MQDDERKDSMKRQNWRENNHFHHQCVGLVFGDKLLPQKITKIIFINVVNKYSSWINLQCLYMFSFCAMLCLQTKSNDFFAMKWAFIFPALTQVASAIWQYYPTEIDLVCQKSQTTLSPPNSTYNKPPSGKHTSTTQKPAELGNCSNNQYAIQETAHGEKIIKGIMGELHWYNEEATWQFDFSGEETLRSIQFSLQIASK